MNESTRLGVVIVSGAAFFAPSAIAQFGTINPQTLRVVQLEGTLLSASGAPAPEAGDEIGAFFGDQIIGSYIFTAAQSDSRAWEMKIFGDDPDTGTVKEGPAGGDVITFKFFDSSTDTTRLDIVATRKDNGEVITVLFPHDVPDTIQFPVNIPGAPPFPGAPGPSIPFNLTLGIGAPGGGGGGGGGDGGGGGGGGGGSGNPDVNGDGKIDKYDAALVIRVMTGAIRGVTQSEAARADVNNDGVVNTNDAILILSNRGKFESTP